MKKNILKYSLFGLILLSGFFSWFSIFNAPNLPGVNAWYISIAFFSLYIVVMCLATVLIRQEIVLELVVAASFLLNLIFAFSLIHLIVLALGILLMLSALRNIHHDLDLNIKVDLWKSLSTGKFKIVWALALVISSQYFFIINSPGGQKVVPTLDLDPITTRLIEPVLSMINPNLKSMQKDGLTVDQFIIQSQQKNEGDISSDQVFAENIIDQQIPQSLPSEQREALKQQTLKKLSDSQVQLLQKNNELILQEGRKQLSQMVGRDLAGNEKITDVFTGLINKKINDFFQPRINGDSKSASYLYILAVILFLTLLSLSVPLSLLWFAIIILIFKLLVYFGLIEIQTVSVQREMIV